MRDRVEPLFDFMVSCQVVVRSFGAAVSKFRFIFCFVSICVFFFFKCERNEWKMNALDLGEANSWSSFQVLAVLKLLMDEKKSALLSIKEFVV